MLFSLANRIPPPSAKALLIAEYVQVNPQTKITTLVDAVAFHYISSGLEQSGRYTLRSAGRSMSGDLRTVAFLWEAQSAATAVEVAQEAKQKLEHQDLVGDVRVTFLAPTPYDSLRGKLSNKKKSCGGINIFDGERLRCYESDGDVDCALHDEILLTPGSLPQFVKAAAELLSAFEGLTGWTFTGAGVDIEHPDEHRLMHFWKMVGLGTIPSAMTQLNDVPDYAAIQGFIVTEHQNFYMKTRRDLPIGRVPAAGGHDS